MTYQQSGLPVATGTKLKAYFQISQFPLGYRVMPTFIFYTCFLRKNVTNSSQMQLLDPHLLTSHRQK